MEAERAYAMVHLQRAVSIVGGYAPGMGVAVPGGTPEPLTEADKADISRELATAMAWLDGTARPRPKAVA